MARITSPETPAVTRTRRSPEQRAQADLDKAQKASDKANARYQKAQTEVTEAQAEVDRAQKYLDYANRNPDLPEGATDETGTWSEPEVSQTPAG